MQPQGAVGKQSEISWTAPLKDLAGGCVGSKVTPATAESSPWQVAPESEGEKVRSAEEARRPKSGQRYEHTSLQAEAVHPPVLPWVVLLAILDLVGICVRHHVISVPVSPSGWLLLVGRPGRRQPSYLLRTAGGLGYRE